ncbi:uncharacterized protein Z520_03147 [Fonsecaea multimorphosa CBS 102226]|uniref:Uncharacterized protein n=1 Tax=Fonsecaea multimorphosa CBS 102226 TaxID=1442371 RepID=A0A0D2KE47_9EURO|nr:uncharacterized protein Z520_03147 [Fonsecaea multimorphosa CBS 102226]KIY01595.1 hypothetical protein Z520_03147 [Fonsecaea multimorphosa CBS 102226]OAL28107.1 hypothetical protein AYO22_03134 [Fonsecaea multimorphosa]
MPSRLLCMTICVPLFFLYLQVVDAANMQARRNPALLTDHQMYGQLMKRDLSTRSNSCLPAVDAASCDGLTGCAADQECCNALGCRPKDSVACGTGYATDGWKCCGSSWMYPASQGAICCGGSQGYWCPAGFQCVTHLIVQYSCCTDDTCNVYWNGTDTVTVSSSSSSTSPTLPPPATAPVTTPVTTPPADTTPLPPPTTKKTSKTTPAASPAATPTTCNPSGPQPTFILQQTSSPLKKENGTYAVLSKIGGGRDKISFGATSSSKATKFTFNKACGLVGVASKEVANLHPPFTAATAPATTLWFDSPANITAKAYTTPKFNSASGGKQLTVSVAGVAEKWFSCNGTLSVGTKAGSSSSKCVKIALTPHFVKS